MARTRISAPASAAQGQIVELKALIQHPMETGFRPDPRGSLIPRNIITQFQCFYDGEEVFRAEFFPAVSANPFLTFHTVAMETGDLEFRWTDQNGVVNSETTRLTVT